MALPDRLRLALAFDPQLLAGDLAQIATGTWTRHFVTQNYDGEWSAIALRAQAHATHPIMMIYPDPGVREFVDTPLLQRMPHIRAALASFRCPLKVVRLMRLAPGSTIKPHRDHDLDAALGVARLHVPVLTNDAVDFRLNGVRVGMAPGECWYLRLSDEHSVVNRGTHARVHLVIDATVDDWLAARLAEAR